MKDLRKFEAAYDSSHEDAAEEERGEFISRFPIMSLQSLRLNDYVIGRRRRSFCYMVEAGSRRWANIQAATAFKFGVYFGRTKSHPAREFRHSRKFGGNVREAFRGVKVALINLVQLGGSRHLDFAAIDANPLSQLFKAKILSLYYPEKFLPVCSADDLEMLGEILGLGEGLESSRYQNLLLLAKDKNVVTRSWSTPKFMAYLYNVYVRNGETVIQSPIRKPKRRTPRRIDFDEIQKQRAELGKRAEEYALKWEKRRLLGAGLLGLVPAIKDRRAFPGFGYDFLSHSDQGVPRYIEVKCVAKINGGQRFFLSDNERQVSVSAEHAEGYYFYLVRMNDKRRPVELLPVTAGQLYANADLRPASYEVRFDVTGRS